MTYKSPALIAGTNVTLTPSGTGNTLTIAATGGGGSGDVVGPASATDNAIVRFDTTTGKLVQNSGITIADGATGTLSGTNTGDQTITLTGDVTGTGTGSFAATIATGAVTYAKLQNASAGNVVLARAAATAGNYGEVALSASQLLGRGASGDVAAITLGTNLSMSGTTLNASGGGSGLTQPQVMARSLGC